MSEERRQVLLQEEFGVKWLIQWHTDNRQNIWDNEQDYQDYIDAALDRLLEIRKELEADKPALS